jgi:hypothetical protein
MEYKYQGLELTPGIFRELLIDLFDGKQFTRQDAVNIVTRYHTDHGGILQKPTYIPTFKKTSLLMRNEGLVKAGYGVWKLNYKKNQIEIMPAAKKDIIPAYTADKEIGSGKKSIYVYYYDNYKELASLKNSKIWECKVGRTDVDPISRVVGQAGTCYPEMPHIALVIYCDDSNLLEKAIHDALRLRNRWLIDSPGKEWFLTSPEEVEEIYNSIIQD